MDHDFPYVPASWDVGIILHLVDTPADIIQ